MSKQEILSLVVAAITDEADGLYELAKSVQPQLAVAHAHALNGALHLLINLLSELDDEKEETQARLENLGHVRGANSPRLQIAVAG